MDTKYRVFSILLAVLFAVSCLGFVGAASAEPVYAADGSVAFRIGDIDLTGRTDAAEEGYVYSGSFVKQSDFASSLNLLRVIKNRYYNALDGALGEDRTIAHLLYRLFDFVYGDSVFDVFESCFTDEAAFRASLSAMNYTEAVIIDNGLYSVTVHALYFGEPRTLTADYHPKTDSALLCIYNGEDTLLNCMEWSATDEGYVLQYMRRIESEEFLALYGGHFASEVRQYDEAEDNEHYLDASAPTDKHSGLPDQRERTNADSVDEGPVYSPAAEAAAKICSYVGYCAYLRDDGTGSISHGPFNTVREASLSSRSRMTPATVASRMFCSDRFSLDDRMLVFADRNSTVAHELGDIFVPVSKTDEETVDDQP